MEQGLLQPPFQRQTPFCKDVAGKEDNEMIKMKSIVLDVNEFMTRTGLTCLLCNKSTGSADYTAKPILFQ
jgi:hypothetical protein